MRVPTNGGPLDPSYVDASALVKCHVPETGSDELNVFLQRCSDLVTSDLAVTEAASALCRRRREGSISREDALRAYRKLRENTEVVFRLADLTPKVHRDTERRLLAVEGVEARAADALHLTLALDAGCKTMVTYDRRLAEASRRHGLAVFP